MAAVQWIETLLLGVYGLTALLLVGRRTRESSVSPLPRCEPGPTTLEAITLLLQQARESQQQSRDVMSLAIEAISSNEREITRDRSLNAIIETMDKLNTTVGNMYLMMRSQGLVSGERTVLNRPMQVGEQVPGAPANRERPPGPKPQEAIVEGLAPPTTAPSAATQVRASALPAHT